MRLRREKAESSHGQAGEGNATTESRVDSSGPEGRDEARAVGPTEPGSAVASVEPQEAGDGPGRGEEVSADALARLRAKVAALEDSLLRAKADFQNLQRRSAVDRAEAVRYANTELMRSLLNVLDDFDRSLAAAERSESLQSVVDGVKLVHANLIKALNDHGLEAIEALHRPFDPNIHEAMLQRFCEDHEPGTVMEQVARGYRLRDRVVRPAKVIVAAAPQPAAAPAPGKSGEKPEGTTAPAE